MTDKLSPKPLTPEQTNRLKNIRTKHLPKMLSELQDLEKKEDRSGNFCVSDHALVRWLERVHGIDIEKLRASVLSEQQKTLIRTGACTLKSDGFLYHINNGVVVTVVKAK